MSTFGTNSILRGAYHYCVVNCRENAYITKIRKDSTSPKYKRKNVSYVGERFSQISPVFSNNESDYLEKLPFQPLPPKVVVKKKNKKKRGRSKKKEETVSSPKHISPIMVVPNEQESKRVKCIYSPLTRGRCPKQSSNSETLLTQSLFLLNESIYGPNAVCLPYFDDMAPSEHCSHVKT